MNEPITSAEPAQSTCRFCATPLRYTLVDLGLSPLCQTHISPDELDRPESFYPLHVRICDQCWLAQLDEFVSPVEIFSEYAYFSSYSDSWVEHARIYVHRMIERLALGGSSRVIEIASNDGYLLQHFVQRGIPVLGIEPAANIAEVARRKGIDTLVRFHGTETARDVASSFGKADLLLGNNVLAHTPHLNDFVAGLKLLLAPAGVITMEFPHLYRLMAENQFDTIYHEHFSYFPFIAVQRIFSAHGLEIFDVDELPTHGGSLRIHAQHDDFSARKISAAVHALREREIAAGLMRMETYAKFGARVAATKRKLLRFLIEAREAGKSIAGYGAPGKGNTLLNYCGIRTDFLDYTVDRNPYKQGKYTPGTRIPIRPPELILKTRPDYVLILPWNLQAEIVSQMRPLCDWDCQFVVPIPEVRVVS